MEERLQPANWWVAAASNQVTCHLCPRNCLVDDGKRGFCGPRINKEGRLFSLAYGYPVALQVDPIEKKPLAEFMPGTSTFSLGTYGCNLNCSFCQNHQLSRGDYQRRYDFHSPERIVELARQHQCDSIAFTYNEPTVFAEYMMDIAREAKRTGLATVMVSNGYISQEAAKDVYPLIDAANIDVKAFTDEFYQTMTGGRLQPVLDAAEFFHSLGKHLELTMLIIPGKNDQPDGIDAYLDWVERALTSETPLHFSAYHPAYRYDESPRTPPEILWKIKERAETRGFQHVRLGNI